MKKYITMLATTGMFAALSAFGQEGETKHAEHQGHAEGKAMEVTVTGEIVDMACYVDHNATGPKHADCARKCISSGLPVGIKGEDGKTYLLIGDHKPINNELASLAAQTVTVKGKLVSRDGFNMIANAEIVKK
jgi:hypothetical protein